MNPKESIYRGNSHNKLHCQKLRAKNNILEKEGKTYETGGF